MDLEILVNEMKAFVTNHRQFAQLSDEQLLTELENILSEKLAGKYISIQHKVDILEQLFSYFRGFGVLDRIMKDEQITELMINGHEDIFIEKDGRIEKIQSQFDSEVSLVNTIQKVVGLAGREVNHAQPIVDTRLPDGSRVNVVLPPVSLSGPVVTIRKFSKQPMTMERLIELGSLTEKVADILRLLVEAKYNIFISGGTGSGKTTFLNALSGYIPKDERIITIEDSAELQLVGIQNLVRLETRNANSSGVGEVTTRDLIRASLRMRPERIIVGEVRGGEALDMLQAMNTGHDGAIATGHANSSQDMLKRIETMVLQGAVAMPLAAIREQVASGIDIIIHLARLRDKTRRAMEITEVVSIKNGVTQLNPLFVFQETSDSDVTNVVGCLVRTNNAFINDFKLKRIGIKEVV